MQIQYKILSGCSRIASGFDLHELSRLFDQKKKNKRIATTSIWRLFLWSLIATWKGIED